MFVKIGEMHTLDLSNLATSQAATVYLCEPVEAGDFKYGCVVARVHTIDTGSNGTVKLQLIPSWPDPADRDNGFAGPGVADATLAAGFVSTTGGSVELCAPCVGVALLATQGSTAGNLSVTFEVGVLLSN